MDEVTDASLQQRFEAAMRAVRERDVALELGLQLDPGGTADFTIALANVDTILSAIAAGAIERRLGAYHTVRQVVVHMSSELLAGDLFGMWSELTDLHDFTATGSDGERDVEMAMREAAVEWSRLSRSDEEEAVRAYFDRWRVRCDLALWRDRMGGPIFDQLNASGSFRWDGA